MNRSHRIILSALILTVAGVALVGCTYFRNMEAMQTERILAAAGFQMKLADTPQKQAYLQSLPPRKLVPHQREGQVYYIYADPTHCNCLYVGTAGAYQRYQKLALEKQIADEQREAAAMNQAAAMDWNMWGPWGPWY